MTKAEFVDKLAAKSGLTKKDAAAVCDAFVEVVTESLKKGEDVQFTGFGKFYVQQREARQVRCRFDRQTAEVRGWNRQILNREAALRPDPGAGVRHMLTGHHPLTNPDRSV